MTTGAASEEGRLFVSGTPSGMAASLEELSVVSETPIAFRVIRREEELYYS